MKIVEYNGIPLVAASWLELGIVVTGFLIIVINSPAIKISLIATGYEHQAELMRLLPEIKEEVNIRFVGSFFNASEMFKPYFKSDGNNLLKGYYIGGVKPTILVSINQTFGDVLFTALHELGHHNWNKYLTAVERESFCQNSAIEAKIGYDTSEWCEESYADYYARQEIVNMNLEECENDNTES